MEQVKCRWMRFVKNVFFVVVVSEVYMLSKVEGRKD